MLGAMFRRALTLLLLTAPLLHAAPAPAAECKPACAELPAMERELFNQEFLQDRFNRYMSYELVANPQMAPDPDHPGTQAMESMIAALQREAAAALTRYMRSAAGGGQSGSAAPGAGTGADCKLYLYSPAGKQIPYNEDKFRQSHKCWDVEFTLAHEGQHVADCKAGKKINEEYESYIASDVRAYGAGVRALRKIIAATAARCGWKGSTRARKPNPVDREDQDVVPTPADVNEILGALKGAPTPAGKGGKK